MRTAFIIVALYVGLAGFTHADPVGGYENRILYWYSQNVSTNVPERSDIVTIKDNGKGDITLIWKIASPPNKTTLDALDQAAVDSWFKVWADSRSGLEIFDTDAGILIRAYIALVKEGTPEPNKTQLLNKFNAIKAAP